jgi:sugar phosphate isomerase/epimerase
MKFAFSTAAVPGWAWREVVRRAKEMGYDGVEWAGPIGPEVGEVARAAREGGVEVACVATEAAYRGRRADDCVSRGVVEAAVDAAREMGCPLVRVLDGREADVIGLGEFLRPLADYALERGVTLVVENALALRTARAMWEVVDRLQHPAVGVCWNLLSATAAGESPYVSVPVLNSRIRYVRVGDATVGGRELSVKTLVERLRGIGYQGYVSVGYGEVGEAYLAEAVGRLREWSRPAVVGKGKAAAKPAAPARAPS